MPCWKTAAIPLLAVLALGDPARAADSPPWSEKVLGTPLDLEAVAHLPMQERIAVLRDHGERLFIGKFLVEEGAGRPMATQAIIPTKRRRPVHLRFQRLAGLDASSCSSCHHEPVVGGGASFTANVFVSEGFESADFDTIDPQFSNERGSPALQGAGLIELLAREMTAELQSRRDTALAQARQKGTAVTAALETKGVSFGTITAHPGGGLDLTGIDGIDADLVLRPFSQKGVFGSLRQFTVNALNHHHGIQPVERFGALWTGTTDFDEDGIVDEIGAADVTALVVWQATLAAPTRKPDLPAAWQQAATRGEALFADTGCASCHIPALPLKSAVFRDPGPRETAGTLREADVEAALEIDLAELDFVKALPRDADGNILVPLFGDLKRHRIADAQEPTLGNELLGQRFVDRDVFLTAELWGAGSTAPYGHRADLTSLDEVIRAHAGEARTARKAYEALPDEDREAIIAFLRSLEIVQ
ncbi:di-heme oxidoredictase family protein [Stappia indica]|uniref:di-heme oxidoredictase family protein n=1 Tax=Stappia indica TaxID=538381 RepID=UPI00082C558E|nr:di-heme oxidoredictase family protein [Stappia indica]